MLDENLVHVGFVSKAFGFSGIFRVNLISSFHLVKPITGYIFILISGKPVPFKITSCTDFSSNYFHIKTDEINSREEALEYQGNKVFLKKKDISAFFHQEWIELDLIGFSVFDSNTGYAGKIHAIEKTPAHFLLILDNGKWLPLHNDLIVNILKDEKILNMNLPEGLL